MEAEWEDISGEDVGDPSAAGFLVEMALDRVVAFLKTLRLDPVEEEAAIHRAIVEAFQKAEQEAHHEYVLGPRARIDFYVPCLNDKTTTRKGCAKPEISTNVSRGIGIEVKKGRANSRMVQEQAERYARFDCIEGLVIAVEASVFVPPFRVCGKPVRTVSLNANWGITL